MLQKLGSFIVLSFTFALFGGVVSAQSDVRSFWKNALRKCSRSDLDRKAILGGTHLFLGLGSSLGPGTIVRVYSDGGFQESRLFSKYTPASREDALNRNNEFTCSGDVASSYSVKPKVGLTLTGLPIGGELAADLKKAKKIVFKIESARWENILVGEYEQMLNDPSSTAAKTELCSRNEAGRDFVISRALKVKGFSATLVYDTKNGTEVKAKFPTQTIQLPLPGEIDTGLGLAWTDNTNLNVSSKAEFYIAAEIRRCTNGRITTSVSKSELGGYSFQQLFYRGFKAQ